MWAIHMTCSSAVFFLSIRLIVLQVSLSGSEPRDLPLVALSGRGSSRIETCDLGQERSYSERVADPLQLSKTRRVDVRI